MDHLFDAETEDYAITTIKHKARQLVVRTGFTESDRLDLEQELMLDLLVHDVLQDKDIWEHKINISPPALVETDGPIGPYRRYTRQFYPEPSPGDRLRVTAS